AVAGGRRDEPRARVDAADAVVMHVGDVDVAGRAFDGDVARHVQVRADRGTAVADVVGIAREAVAGDRVNQTGLRVDQAHAIVQRVGDVDVAVGGDGDRARRVERRLHRGLVVAIVAVL